MFDADTFTKEMLSNPTKLSAAVIDAMEASDTTDVVSITDPNNGFVLQLFANTSIFSKFSEKIDYVTGMFYPQRSRSAEQLYPKLSQFDYTNLTSSPATLPFSFALSRDWIVANSVYYDGNYNKIEIPRTSTITMGGITYSMYYPIQILVNRNTSAVTAYYDTTTVDSLNTLSSNMLLDVQEYTRDGINWFQIQFNAYQFDRQINIVTVAAEQGFVKSFTYPDQFYAVKVYTLISGSWIELKYSLPQMFYDYQSPTALLSFLTDASQIKVEIPQIYFDNGQISQTIKVEVYSTKGAVNYFLSYADVQDISTNFDTSSTPFAAPLAKPPSWSIAPTVTQVVGGSNAMTYAQIRDAVVNQRLYDRVAVTTPQITQAFKKAGFDAIKVIDDLTERMFFAANVLTDAQGFVVPTFAGNILLADDALQGNPSTILRYSDGYLTLLPTTTFTISDNGETCLPLTDGQVATIAAMTTQQLVTELNKGTYVRQPFHLTLLTNSKSPQACVYNLLNPQLTSLVFVQENVHSAPQMSATSCVVTHLNNGTGGFLIQLGITRSSNLVGVDASNLYVTLTCQTKTGSFAYLPLTYVSTNSDDLDTWQVKLSTSYHITVDDYITVMMNNDQDILSVVDISLNQNFTIATSFISTYDSTIPVNAVLNTILPPSFQTTQNTMAQQTALISFGHNLSSQIYTGVNTSWGNDVYQTATETIYYTTDIPLFQMTNTNVINYRYDSTTHNTDVVVLYPQGSTPASDVDITIAVTQNAYVSGQPTQLTIDSVVGLLVGQLVRGTAIPINSHIQAITGNVITLSTIAATTIPVGTQIVVTNARGGASVTQAQTQVSKILTLDNTVNMVPGHQVFGFDLSPGTIIVSVDSDTQITLSTNSLNPVALHTLITTINTQAPGVVKTKQGDVLTDAAGRALIEKDAQNQYLIPSILFDGRLFASQDPNDQQIVTGLAQRLQNYANQIADIDTGLMEYSDVYYKPARTMGPAIFGIGSGQTITLSLELSFVVTIYVDQSVYNTQALLSTMDTTVISIINQSIQNSIISVSRITQDINTALGTTSTAVEMDGISGRSDLRLISLEQTGTQPSVENILVIEADGSVSRQPNIVINHRPKPDTTEISQIAS